MTFFLWQARTEVVHREERYHHYLSTTNTSSMKETLHTKKIPFSVLIGVVALIYCTVRNRFPSYGLRKCYLWHKIQNSLDFEQPKFNCVSLMPMGILPESVEVKR